MKNKISGRREGEREELEPDVGRGGVNYTDSRGCMTEKPLYTKIRTVRFDSMSLKPCGDISLA